MFYFTYLFRELRRRMRQSVFIALGLAIGVGLVLTVTAASAGVRNAQAGVLKGLYGVGTDITVTGKPPSAQGPTSKSGSGGGVRIGIMMGPNGAQMCVNGKCHSLKNGYTIDNLVGTANGPISQSEVAKIRALRDVSAAAGGLLLTDNQTTVSQTMAQPVSFTVDGTDLAHQKLGPLSEAVLTSGRGFTSADAKANVALVDKNYATSHSLKAGGTMKIGGVKFTIIGIVTQPEASGPPNVYIPLTRAQAVATNGPAGKSLTNEVNTIYVTASSGTAIDAVQKEIAKLLPSATITTPSSLASQVSGSVTSAARLADDLGKWLSVLVLIAAFAVAVLLTMAAVARRVREFGTLKALGWRGRRIIAQVMGESIAVGVLGAALGIGLGYAGAATINAIAPSLSATLTQATGLRMMTPNGAVDPTSSHTVSVPMIASVGGTAIIVAVALALAGGLLAGVFGSWRIGRLRPADALSKVG
ncbi:MAG TPA: ABC transporter permease [Trebonia sp.]|nr:ABC transporter permease [Trebonia sp.]